MCSKLSLCISKTQQCARVLSRLHYVKDELIPLDAA